jgi:hypothetical protein
MLAAQFGIHFSLLCSSHTLSPLLPHLTFAHLFEREFHRRVRTTSRQGDTNKFNGKAVFETGNRVVGKMDSEFFFARLLEIECFVGVGDNIEHSRTATQLILEFESH